MRIYVLRVGLSTYLSDETAEDEAIESPVSEVDG